ncbi:GNAT family N-acetyltransferase [Streptomyces poonensis]|uniref:GNAT family N-acetyltransferase n=1 Tax=Streptomyces poonensis TaxID=68255 RepID=UPI001676D327|nr:GNAT family N-acetyltransferase [Streptomyces poonensis]
MDRAGVLAEFDRDVRQGARPDTPDARIDRVDGVVRLVTGEGHGGDSVLWSDLDEATADEAVAAQLRYFAGLGRAFEWKLYGHDRPADLGKRLRAAGFTPEPEETLMIADLSRVALDAEPPLLRVTDAAGVDMMAEVHARAFGRDSASMHRDLLARIAADPDTVAAVLALAGDRPVSAARMELVPGTRFAGLWGGGTVEDWRGRGIYRALVSYRARLAAELGYRYVQVDAGDMSRPVLERLGFVPLTTTTPYLSPPDTRGTPGTPGTGRADGP